MSGCPFWYPRQAAQAPQVTSGAIKCPHAPMPLCGPEEQSMDLMAAPTSRAAPIWRPRAWQMARDPARLITCWIPTTMKSECCENRESNLSWCSSCANKLIMIRAEEPGTEPRPRKNEHRQGRQAPSARQRRLHSSARARVHTLFSHQALPSTRVLAHAPPPPFPPPHGIQGGFRPDVVGAAARLCW